MTEDSLNRVTYNVTEIQTDEKQSDDIATEIPSAIESTPSKEISSAIESTPSKERTEVRLNVLHNQSQLIEDTSFPHVDGLMLTVDSEMSALSTNSESPMKEIDIDDNRYQSDDFEEAKSTDVPTSIDTITRGTAHTSDARSETPADQCSSPTELELRLISLDDGMKELSEAISQSPVLSCGEGNNSGSDKHDSDLAEDIERPAIEAASDEASSIPTAVESESTETVTSNGVSSPEESAEKDNAESNTNDSVEESPVDSIVAEQLAENGEKPAVMEVTTSKRPFQYAMSAGAIDYNKVPEADALKRSQTPVEVDQV